MLLLMQLPEDFLDASVLMVLHNGEVTLVDYSQYEQINHLSWTIVAKGYSGRRLTPQGCELLHRRINNTPPGMDTDHINGFRMDNRKCNLRTATRSQNNANQKKKSGTYSRFKGVSWDKRKLKWQAGIKINGKRKALGRFDNEEDASKAYSDAAKRAFGEYHGFASL